MLSEVPFKKGTRWVRVGEAVMAEAEAKAMQGHEARNAGSPWKLEKAPVQQTAP